MIVYDLECGSGGHRFEGWFASSDDFADQQARGLVACPHCGGTDVAKAAMAPAVGRKGNQQVVPPAVRKMFEAVASAQTEALKTSRWVGSDFAEQSRAIHYGEQAAETIHGQASAEEARALLDEGIGVMPVLVPVVPPEQVN